MASLEDVRGAAIAMVQMDESAQESIDEIKKICQYLYHAPDGGKAFLDWGLDDLTRASAQLALLRVTLGEVVSKYVALANYGTFYRKLALAKERHWARKEIEAKLGKVSAQGEIDAYILSSIEKEWKQEIRYQELADYCKTYLDNTDKVLVAINHRIRVLSMVNSERLSDSSTTVTPPRVVQPGPIKVETVLLNTAEKEVQQQVPVQPVSKQEGITKVPIPTWE